MPLPAAGTAEHIAPLTLVDAAYDRVLQLVVTGELAPGEQLREEELARWLGISPRPTRIGASRCKPFSSRSWRARRTGSCSPSWRSYALGWNASCGWRPRRRSRTRR
jgi:hypothetical protein